ncbi:IS3 family transposase [Pseudarthrobacter sp. NS4]|uniref:IS3 family transposase n=1 Tax=Pseudarthrobacter sp. NS4 TaxID=2973976 RepID=UPI0037CC3DBB
MGDATSNSSATPRKDLFHHVRFISAAALPAQLTGYIHGYTTERIPAKQEGLSPVQYRAQALAAPACSASQTWGPLHFGGGSLSRPRPLWRPRARPMRWPLLIRPCAARSGRTWL